MRGLVMAVLGENGAGPIPPEPIEEKIVYKMNADSGGYLYVPITGVSSTGGRKCPYSWKISIDDGAPVTYSGTGSAGGKISLSGYASGSSHTISITPNVEKYQRARAFGWYGLESISVNLTEIIYDKTYMGYGVSATDTGNFFRAYQYRMCAGLTNTAIEFIPNTVINIGTNFREGQYYKCTSLTTAATENMPNSVTTIGNSFRTFQYSGCTSLTTAAIEALSNNVTSIGNNFRSQQYIDCTSLTTAATEVLPNSVTTIGDSFRGTQYQGCTSLTTPAIENMPNSVTTIGNSFRIEQYKSCTNLTTTATEVLPNSVTTIGNSFRYTQYSGCTSLTTAAIEVLPNSVTTIGNSFRGSQYSGCTSLYIIPKWIETNYGTDNRNSQFNNTASNKIITVVGSVSGKNSSNTGIVDDDVSTVYVNQGFLQDYKDSESYPWVDITDSKFVGTTDNITYKMLADTNGKLYVPISGYNYDAEEQDCPYDWDVSVDGTFINNYSGTGSAGGAIELTGYIAGTEHEITIAPHGAIAYLRARAYGWDGVSSASNLTEIIFDESYIGYGVSATDTGGYFRKAQYLGCNNIIGIPVEYLPNTVTTIGAKFRANQYYSCSSIEYAVPETLPTGITTIGNNFREGIYANCTSLTQSARENIPNSVTTIMDRFRENQYYNCTSLTVPAGEVLPDSVTSIGAYFRSSQYANCTSLIHATFEVIPDTIQIGSGFRATQYQQCTSLEDIPLWKEPTTITAGSSTTDYRYKQFYGCTNPKAVKVSAYYGPTADSDTLQNDYVTNVYVYVDYLSDFVNCALEPWASITDSKFVGYHNPGIYYNSTLGLLSITGDGIEWLTLADKNLGATVVYNNGDTLDSNNCGDMYQWGNMRAFVSVANSIDNTISPDNPVNPATVYTASTLDLTNSAYYYQDGGRYYATSVNYFVNKSPWWDKNTISGSPFGTNGNLTGRDSYQASSPKDITLLKGQCSTGYHVPLISEWDGIVNIIISYGIASNQTSNFISQCLFMPFGGQRKYSYYNTQSRHQVGTLGIYMASDCPASYTGNYRLNMTVNKATNTASTQSFGDCQYIRPFKDTPAIPDSTRTVLFQPQS